MVYLLQPEEVVERMIDEGLVQVGVVDVGEDDDSDLLLIDIYYKLNKKYDTICFNEPPTGPTNGVHLSIAESGGAEYNVYEAT
jgi:hypothetical protein